MGGLQIHQNSVPIIIWQYSLMKIEWLFSYSRWHLTKTVDWNSFIEYSAKLIARLVTRSSVELWQAMIELYCQSHCRRCTRSKHCKSWRVLPLRVSHAEWSRKPFIRTVVSRSLLINFSLKIFVLTIRPEWNTYVLDNVWTSMRFVYMTAAAVLREAGERPL